MGNEKVLMHVGILWIFCKVLKNKKRKWPHLSLSVVVYRRNMAMQNGGLSKQGPAPYVES